MKYKDTAIFLYSIQIFPMFFCIWLTFLVPKTPDWLSFWLRKATTADISCRRSPLAEYFWATITSFSYVFLYFKSVFSGISLLSHFFGPFLATLDRYIYPSNNPKYQKIMPATQIHLTNQPTNRHSTHFLSLLRHFLLKSIPTYHFKQKSRSEGSETAINAHHMQNYIKTVDKLMLFLNYRKIKHLTQVISK